MNMACWRINMKLENVNWQEYHLYDLFTISSGNKFDKSKMTAYDPSVNFVGRSSTRNGVTAYVDAIDGVDPYQPGCMTIALGGEHLGSCFIQLHPFYTSQNVVVLSEKISMTENVKIFISHIIRNESKNNYMAFARELNAHVRTDFVIKLPSLKPGVPDCEFMDKYIENLKRDFSSVPDYFLNEGYDKAFWYLDNINQEDFERDYAGISVAKSIALSDRKWDYFTLEDIVSSVHNGKSYNASDLVVFDGEEYVSYVTRTDENNGVSMYVQALDYQGLEKANAITIGDTTATIFFQEHEFITGPHIIVIRADWLNVYTANFIITILNQEKYRYPVFGRAFTKDLIKQTKVYLPIDKDGNPDYRFMEDYIKSLPFSKKI